MHPSERVCLHVSSYMLHISGLVILLVNLMRGISQSTCLSHSTFAVELLFGGICWN
jgi:hypothetical protein